MTESARPGRLARLLGIGRPDASDELAEQAAVLVGTGLVDTYWYARLSGTAVTTPEEAARHFLSGGSATASFHPLVDLASLPRHLREGFAAGRARPWARFLAHAGVHRPLGPLFDPRRLHHGAEAMAAHPGGALGLFLEDADDSTPLPGLDDLTLGRARRLLASALDPAATHEPAPAPTPPPVVSIVVVVSADAPTVTRALDAALRHAADISVEAVVVERGPEPLDRAHLAAFQLTEARLRRASVPDEADDRTARAAGAAVAAGEHLALLDPGAWPRPGWLAPLVERLGDPEVSAAAPLVLRHDDTIVAMSPDPHLDGHPREDAVALAGALPQAPGEALLLRTRDIEALETADLPGRVVLVPSAQVNLAAERSRPPRVSERPPSTTRAVVAEARPRLRWGLKIAAPGGDRGDAWGDAHFADSLAAALRRAGQEVVIHRRRAHDTAATALDDVSLALRGLDVVVPQPHSTNVIWVISHPDDVDPAELHGYDVALAASVPWAAEMSRRSRREVIAMLQATDLLRRASRDEPVGDGSDPVFVGATNPSRPRPIVTDALRAGVPLTVHGPNWEGIVPAERLGSTYVPNDALSSVYRRHGLVLADHWPDMAARGFLANRLFDAVAAGARVVCDQVTGLDVFGGAVQAYASLDDLADLCSDRGRPRFPGPAQMEQISETIAREHSFDARAGELVTLVTAHRRRGVVPSG